MNELNLTIQDLDDWKLMVKEIMDVKEKLRYFQNTFLSPKARTDYAKYLLKVSQVIADMRNTSDPKLRHLFTKMNDEGTALGAIIGLFNQVNEQSLDELLVVVQAMANGYPVDFVQYDKGTTEEERRQCAELNGMFNSLEPSKKIEVLEYLKSLKKAA